MGKFPPRSNRRGFRMRFLQGTGILVPGRLVLFAIEGIAERHQDLRYRMGEPGSRCRGRHGGWRR